MNNPDRKKSGKGGNQWTTKAEGVVRNPELVTTPYPCDYEEYEEAEMEKELK